MAALERLSERVDQLKKALDDGKLDYRELPPLFDAESLFEFESWQPRAECRLFIANGDYDAIPDEVFAVLFKPIAYKIKVTLRAVCQRFRRIIDDPFYALRCWEQRESLGTTDNKNNPIEFKDNPISLFRTNTRQTAFELRGFEVPSKEKEGDRAIPYCLDLMHRGQTVTFEYTARARSPRGPIMFRLLASRPHWFIEARLNFPEKFGEVILSCVVNVSQVEMDCRADPIHSLADAAAVFQVDYLTGFNRQFKQHLIGVLSSDLPMVSREIIPHTILPTHREVLTTAQQELVEWLQHAEHCVLHGEPLTVMKPRLRMSMMVGTGFYFAPTAAMFRAPEVLHLDDDKDPTRIALDSRGVVVADEPGLGQTLAVAEFLLIGVPALSHLPSLVAAGDPATVMDTGASPHQLLWTKAIDFGMEMMGEVVEELLPFGMLHTGASLLVTNSTTYSTWKREVTKFFPHKRVLFVGAKSSHERLTYGEVATADLVVVTAQFLMNRTYYEGLRWPGLQKKSGRIRKKPTIISEAKKSFKLLTAKHGQLDFHSARPLFEWFAWPRVVVDEIHTYVPGRVLGSASLSDFNKLGLEFFSARFVVAISATPHMMIHKSGHRRNHDGSQFVDLILAKWMRATYRLSNITMDCFALPVPRPRYLQDTLPDQSVWIGPYSIMFFETDVVMTTQGGVHLRSNGFGLAHQAMPALFHRNTIKNVTRMVDIPPVKKIRVNVRMNPSIAVLQTLINDAAVSHVCNLYRLSDFPRPLATLRATNFRGDIFNQLIDSETLWGEFTRDVKEDVDRFNRVAKFITEVDPSRVPDSKRIFVTQRMAAVQETVRVLADLPQRLEEMTRLLQERVAYYGPVERRHGSRAHFLIHAVRTALAHSPDVRVVVATDHKVIVSKLLTEYVDEPFVTLGGLNLRSMLANETAFTEGTVRLLVLDARKAAEGLNLQRAHVLVLDGQMAPEDCLQLVGRVRRFGAKQPLLVIERDNSHNTIDELLNPEDYQ